MLVKNSKMVTLLAVNTVYNYSVTTTDVDNDQIYFKFSWGDGEKTDWLGPYYSGDTCEASHSWSERGTYSIRVQSKDSGGHMSEWSDPLSVQVGPIGLKGGMKPKTY